MLNNQHTSSSYLNQHLLILLKYSGISFISGAINHGFFSEERSILTALFGIILFIIAAIFEHRNNIIQYSNTHSNLVKSIIFGAILSIGLGLFTGGLQHFPDSPERSSWVVPLGFIVSLFGLIINNQITLNKKFAIYAILATGIVAILSSVIARALSKPSISTLPTLSNSTQAYQLVNKTMHTHMNIEFTGDADIDFLAGMIPHHQGAIDMANTVLIYGKNSEIKALAHTIINAQQTEISQMHQLQSKLSAPNSDNSPKKIFKENITKHHDMLHTH